MGEIYNILLYQYHKGLRMINRLRSWFFSKEIDYKKIPIIINNRNRLSFLIKLIKSLETRGYDNIIILDNNSTYEPLLEYYKNIKFHVEYLGENLGFDALEKTKLFKTIRRNYYVYTDSDLMIVEDCPDNFLGYFLKVLKENKSIQKVGFSLKIDDLPNHYKDKDRVIEWESKFYSNQFKDNLFLAEIDTTFALHRPYALISTKGMCKHLRVDYPYSAYHLPWYNDSDNLTDEEIFYIEHVEIGTHWSKGLKIIKINFFRRFYNKLTKQ